MRPPTHPCPTVVDCFYFDTDLRDRWCAEALKWACNAHCRHCASRSHQVFVALRPALGSTSCTALLAALLKCLQSTSELSLDTAVELLCTLRALQAGLGPAKVVLFPQLFLACVALLNSSVVRIGELAMHILLQASLREWSPAAAAWPCWIRAHPRCWAASCVCATTGGHCAAGVPVPPAWHVTRCPACFRPWSRAPSSPHLPLLPALRPFPPPDPPPTHRSCLAWT